MDLNYLKKILKIFDDSSATIIEIKEDSLKIKISKNDENLPVINSPILQAQSVADSIQTIPLAKNEQNEPTKKEKKKEYIESGHKIKSPIVGTFYKSPSPDSPSFVEIGSHINKGDTLCIVEAMKLMNEIESDISGYVKEISIGNAEPVEYGQTLFIIKPD